MMDISRPESCRLDFPSVLINCLLLPILHFMERKLLYTVHIEKKNQQGICTPPLWQGNTFIKSLAQENLFSSYMYAFSHLLLSLWPWISALYWLIILHSCIALLIKLFQLWSLGTQRPTAPFHMPCQINTVPFCTWNIR